MATLGRDEADLTTIWRPAGPVVVLGRAARRPRADRSCADTGRGGELVAIPVRIFTAKSSVWREDEKHEVAACPAGTRGYSDGAKIVPECGGDGAAGDLVLNSLHAAGDANGFDSLVAPARRRVVEGQAILARFDWSLERSPSAVPTCRHELVSGKLRRIPDSRRRACN